MNHLIGGPSLKQTKLRHALKWKTQAWPSNLSKNVFYNIYYLCQAVIESHLNTLLCMSTSKEEVILFSNDTFLDLSQFFKTF